MPKMTFLGHKRVLWLQSDETVWNKGGKSQGTSGVVLRNSFVGHRGPSRCIKGSNEDKNVLFWPLVGLVAHKGGDA